MPSQSVFVCGATGTQGGALTNQLLGKDISINAITRNINSTEAQRLVSLGVSLTEGDFDDEECLKKAMADCTSLFLNLRLDLTQPTAELDQARKIISVAKKAGIKHVIYTSALATNSPERLPHWTPSGIIGMLLLGKQAIENEVKAAGFETWTILRPGNFMSNFLDPLVRMYQGLVETGKFTTAFLPDTIIPMSDPNDIGKFAAAAILEPAKFNHQEIETVSQMMTAKEIVKDLSAATGKDIRAVFLSEEEITDQLPKNPILGPQKVMRDLSMFVEMKNVQKWGIELGTFAGFLEREKERVDRTYL
ncbi:uncharacterized protein N7484_005741 [Penicillium longicatenatum]|uniref:uncharacterized protein n=1 Tax=Penicillium longicatenatum TaxID=1561947 RepID=UPI002547F907|nr:uncharacterized protein N7484_005741 [Penicillium longicatenatum]KAJ5643234.1 hypothetical protein N7484_005741 [Penicillium longicatenatum]